MNEITKVAFKVKHIIIKSKVAADVPSIIFWEGTICNFLLTGKFGVRRPLASPTTTFKIKPDIAFLL